MKTGSVNFNVKIKLVGFGRQKIGLYIIAVIAKIFNIECDLSAEVEKKEKMKTKKGKFAFRIRFIKFLIESLMKSKIDEYEGSTIIAQRTKKTMQMGYVIGSGLINALSQLHSEITEAEKANSIPTPK